MSKTGKNVPLARWWAAWGILTLLVSCGGPLVRKAPRDACFLYRNRIDVSGPDLTAPEKSGLAQKMQQQLDDSAKIKLKRRLLVLQVLKRPIRYDSRYSQSSAENMKAALFHLGYYQASVRHTSDTSGRKVSVTYQVQTGRPTLIRALDYQVSRLDLAALMESWRPGSLLRVGEPVTKAAVITELGRLVDSFRNNGYYKFSAAELRVSGDTTTDTPESLSRKNAPFKNLAEVQRRIDSPGIRLAIVLNPPSDSTRLKRYYIRRIWVLPEYRQGLMPGDPRLTETEADQLTICSREGMFLNRIITRNIRLKPGQLMRQSDYYNTLYQLSRAGVWQNVNIQVQELPGGSDSVNLVIELTPSKKYGFETALELSYSAASNTSNVLAGNLFGISGNLSLVNRNLGREGIRMGHTLRAGIELNNNRGISGKLINSNEVSYNNTTSFPRLILPGIPNAFNRKNPVNQGETFINAGVAYTTRLNLFNLQSVNAGFGWTGVNRRKWKWVWTSLNFGFSNLFNQSDSFRRIVAENPFLRYSYNTAFVNGMGISFTKVFTRFRHPHSQSKELAMRWNAEESGLTWGLIPLFNKYKRRYIKTDLEVTHTIRYAKTSLAFRGFVGVGIPLLGIDTNRTLPFFKQYFGGGSNSMRAWPVRGIGPGGRPLVPFTSNRTIFNDRTGDLQFEVNAEYRYDIARIIPNTLTLRGALFADIGNIWNLRNTTADGSADTSQFALRNFYAQLGLSAGTGFRLDFNYFVLRLDFGFRFKRPELYYVHDGWKAPSIGFDDFIRKIFTRGDNDMYRRWRYENFNFTIGIGYSF